MTQPRPPQPVPAPGPAPAAPARWQLDLEEAYAALRALALRIERDLEAAPWLEVFAARVGGAQRALLDAFDGRDERALAAQRAMHEVDGALAAAPAAAGAGVREALAAARAALGRAEQHLAMHPPAPFEAPELLVSLDTPRLHWVARPSIVPRIVVPLLVEAPPAALPAPAAAPTSFAELAEASALARQGTLAAAARAVAPPQALPAPAATIEAPPAVSEESFVRERARDCFEEVTMAGMQRIPLPGDPWRTSVVIEQRLLASLDLVAGLGPVAVGHVADLYRDSPIKDPSRAFAVGMILGSIAGRDALGAAEQVVLAGDADAAVLAALGDALALVPHADLPLALATASRDASVAVRAMAWDVIARRGLRSVDELAAAAHDKPPVTAVLLEHLALGGFRDLPAWLEALRPSPDPALRAAVNLATALGGVPYASTHLAAAADAPWEGEALDHPAVLWAIAGDEQDAAALLDRATRAPAPHWCLAVGWAGAAAAIPRLLELLAHEDEAVRVAAGGALYRITGASLVELVPLDEEEIHVPEPRDPPVGERPAPPRLARVVSSPRDQPPEASPEMVERPTTNAGAWQDWWARNAAAFDAQGRYRHGRPYTPALSLHELDAGVATFAERRALQRELVVRTGVVVRFDPRDFVRTQEVALEAWAPEARRMSSVVGRWQRPARRR